MRTWSGEQRHCARGSPSRPQRHGFVALLPSIRKQQLRCTLAPYPAQLETLGDHLRFVRLEHGLRQKDVAKTLQIDVWTLLLWEKGRTEPLVRHYPRIMEFLGYCPMQYARTRGEQFRLFRTHRGFTQGLVARYLAVDPNTIAAWEADRETDWPDHARKIERFLAGAPSPEEVEANCLANPDHYRYAVEPRSLGERLRRARIERKLRLVDVARIIGVRSARTVSAWERGEAEPLAVNVERLWQFLKEIVPRETV
ncbi:MAG: helix-turn-helix domain-containing protein [Proteobacteria bacterium]|nr:MAG: helix-turn-helix domain-containing protein [Pseudomonadota bacterium]